MKDGLSNRGLNVARHPGPGATSINTELGVLLAGRKPKQLPKKGQGFLTKPSCGLKNGGAEKERSAPEALVVLRVLDQPIGVCWAVESEVSGGERAGHSHVHCQALGVFPTGNCDIPGPATRSLT